MDRILVALAGEIDNNLIVDNYDFVIAVDGGYDNLLTIGITPNILIGDLDSITTKLEIQTVKFDSMKDETDYLCALNYIEANFSNYEIDVIGFASTNRIDHVLANLSLFDSRIKLLSSNQKISFHEQSFVIKKSEYMYVSFFSQETIDDFNLSGFVYDLKKYKLKPFDPLCISNEVKRGEAFVNFDKGKLICIQSKEN